MSSPDKNTKASSKQAKTGHAAPPILAYTSDASSGVPVFDPKAAEKAFKEFLPRLQGISSERFVAVNLDVQKAAISAAATGRWVKTPAIRAEFAALPAKRFQMQWVDELEAIALAVWHAAVTLLTASSSSSEAKLPTALVERALSLRARMIKLLEYHFGEDAIDGPEISAIKQGTGYLDLANDLVRLAKLYKKRRALVKLDPSLYVATDEADARRTAQEIMTLLGEARNQDQTKWSDLQVRAFTLLYETYDEVAQAGSWLFRNEGGQEKFPSLYAVGREGQGRPRSASEDKKPAGEGTPEGSSDPGKTEPA